MKNLLFLNFRKKAWNFFTLWSLKEQVMHHLTWMKRCTRWPKRGQGLSRTVDLQGFKS